MTKAEQLAELEAELVIIKAQMLAITTGGQSLSLSGMNVSKVNYPALKDRRIEVEKSIQRLTRGGREMVMDMSATPYGGG